MNSLTLQPMQKQLYQLHTEHSHPKLSMTRVLYVKWLRWLDKESPRTIAKTLCRAAITLLIFASCMAPSFMLGMLTSAATFNGYRTPIALALFLTLLKVKPMWRWLTTGKGKPRSNQHQYHGLPVSEFASFLLNRKTFKVEDGDALGLSQGQFKKIAEELENAGVLCRDKDNGNARTLRPITLEELVRQLRENFPMVWDNTRQLWADRDGPFNQWVLSREFQRRKLDEKLEKRIERKERKIEKLDEEIEERSPVLSALFAH